MSATIRRFVFPVVVVLISLCVRATELRAGSHLWRINEVFSNADGTVQFIELHEILGAANEKNIGGHDFVSDVTESTFTFPDHLTESTANKYLLLATQAFADLPDAPQPDYVIPAHFVATDGDTLRYSTFARYDVLQFGSGELPLDGLRSIHVTAYSAGTDDETIVDVNSPTNFAGDSGSIDVSEPTPAAPFSRGDCNADGSVDLPDAVALLEVLFRAAPLPACLDACDSNDDARLDVSDAVMVLLSLFVDSRPLPAPTSCGEDETEDSLHCESFAGCGP